MKKSSLKLIAWLLPLVFLACNSKENKVDSQHDTIMKQGDHNITDRSITDTGVTTSDTLENKP